MPPKTAATRWCRMIPGHAVSRKL